MSNRIKMFRLIWNLGIIFFGGAFTFLPIWAEATHSIRLSPGVGFGRVDLAEREAADAVNNPYNAYQLARTNALFPFSQTKKNGLGAGGLSQFLIQYRFEDNLRISAGYREFNPLYETRTTFIPGIIFAPSSDIYKWSEKRVHVGLEYYFPLGNVLKAGPSIKYYDVTQSYKNRSSSFYGVIYNNASFTFSTNGTEVMDGRYTGFAPGLGLEIIPAKWFRIGLSGEYIMWKGKKNTYFPNYSQITSGNTQFLAVGNFSDSGIVNFRGFFYDINFQFRPFSLFGFTIGYHRENYSRTYQNYSYKTLTPEDPSNVAVYNSLVKNTNTKFASETYYLILDFIIDIK